MKVITIILTFEDGRQVAAIAPDQEIPDSEIENAIFCEPVEAPDMMLSDISTMRYEENVNVH